MASLKALKALSQPKNKTKAVQIIGSEAERKRREEQLQEEKVRACCGAAARFLLLADGCTVFFALPSKTVHLRRAATADNDGHTAATVHGLKQCV